MTVLGWVIFIFALCVSIMVHEAGHFITAKKFRMKVTQFFVGFGRTLWSWTRGETEYGIKVLLVGGYVRIIGMTTLDDVDPADEPRSFRRQPAWQRMIVLAAGSFMHFVFAFVVLFILAAAIGLPNTNTSTVGVESCLPASLNSAHCAPGSPASPAMKAGFHPGDTIIAVGGKKVSTWNQAGAAIRSQPLGQPVAVVVVRDGRQLTLHPRLTTVKGQKTPFLGVSDSLVYQTAGPVSAVTWAGSQFGQVVVESVQAAGSIPKAIPELFAKNRGGGSGAQVTTVIGAGEYTGQAFAAQVSWQTKAWVILFIVVSLNIFVGLLNLLPLLPMDGGHLAVVIYESIRSRLARLRGRPDPGLVDMRKVIPVSFGVFALLVGLSLLLVTADLINPVHIPQ